MNQSDRLLAPVTNSQSSGPSARQRRGLQDDVAVALGGDVLWLVCLMLAEMGIMLIYYASIMLYYAKNYAILC